MSIPVTLHIYHVSTDSRVGAINEYLEAMGTGAFHAGVEVNGAEWSYGYTPDNTGVFSCPPKGCKAHVYKDSIEMGDTPKSSGEIKSIIEKLKAEWLGMDYDLLRKNCCIFSKELCDQLGVGEKFPSWVVNLAAAGATVHDGILKGKEYADKAAIMAKAKAGEFDEKYNISGTAKAAAKEVLEAAGKFDEQYKVREKAMYAAAAAQAKAGELGKAAQEHAAAVHKEMDKDGDGQVSTEEKMYATDRAGACACGSDCSLQ